MCRGGRGDYGRVWGNIRPGPPEGAGGCICIQLLSLLRAIGFSAAVPELEALIQRDVQRGPYQSADESVERAVEMLHEQEEWLAGNRTEIATEIEHGFAQAERGELVDGEEAFQKLRQRREERRNQG